MKEDQNIDELFRSSFEEFGVTPPPAVKEAIDRQIAASSSGKRGLFWFLFAFISLGSLTTFLLWPSSATTSTAKPALAQQTTASATSGSSATISSSGASSTATVDGSSSANATTSTQRAAVETLPENGITASSAKTSPSGMATASSSRYASAKTAKHSSSSPAKSGKQTTNPAGAKKSAAQNKNGSTAKSGVTSKKKKNRTKKSPGILSKKGSGASSASASSENGGTASSATNGGTPSANGGQLPSGGALASGGTTPPNAATGGNPVIPPATSDSTKTTVPPTGEDSTKTATPEETTPTPQTPDAKKPASKTDWWRMSLYGGPQIAFNKPRTTTDMQLTERPAFQLSAEVNRSLWNGYGVSTGIQYANRRETLNKTTTTSDTTSIWVMNPIYDPQVPDSIIGYDSVMQSQVVNTKNTYQQLNHIQSFGIPLYVTKHFEFGNNWGVLVNLGTIFQFYKVTVGATDNIPAPTVHNFSMNVVGRVHATYRWKGGWMISAGLSGGLDLKPAAIYVGMDRKRYYLTPQIGLHYSF